MLRAMADALVGFDTAKPTGSKFSDAVKAEILAIAPAAPPDGTITEVKLAPEAVAAEKIKPGAVGSPQIAAGGVESVNLAASAVTTGKLASGAVTADKAGAGVTKARDTAGNAIALTIVPITALEYAALTSPDPNVLYGIHS